MMIQPGLILLFRFSKRPGRLLAALLLSSFAFTVMDAQWTKSAKFDDGDMAIDLADALTFQKYPTYYQYLEMMQGFAAAYPGICRLDTIGYSVQDRLLLALKISDHVDEDEAEASFLYTSTMHGNEIVGFVLLLRMADTLLKGYGQDTEIDRIVNNLQIWINPLANPDGSYSNGNNLSLENATRANVMGIDLNRDFPDPASGEPDDTTGRALEDRYMMSFMSKHRFSMSANLHSGAEVVNYPWDHTPRLHADDAWFRFVSREYADEAMAVDPDYMWGWPDDGITNGWDWYAAFGLRQDYVNYYLGGREVTLELSDEFLLPSAELEHHWNINRRSLLNYMSQLLYGIRGRVTDLETGEALRARVFVMNHDSAYSVVHSSALHGDYYRLIREGVYDLVVSAPGFMNDTILAVTVTDYQATRLDIQLQKDPSVGLESGTLLPGFRIYPNPAINNFVVEAENIPHGKLDIWVYAVDGRTIYHHSRPYHGNAIEFSTAHMEPGIYLVRCTSGTFLEVHRLMVIKP